MDPHPSKQLALALPVVVLILGFTAIPTGVRPPSAGWTEVVDFGIDFYDLLVNIAGYVPVGLVLASRGLTSVAAAGAAISLLAETTQLITPGREPSLLDLAANTVGATIGWAACRYWRLRPLRLELTRSRAIQSLLIALLCALVATRLTPLAVENWVIAFARAVPHAWLPGSERGLTAPGKLEARWTFDGNQSSSRAGSQSVADVSGNGAEGALVNDPLLAPGISDQALVVNGKNQYAEFPTTSSLQLAGSMTVAAWINPTSFPVSDAAIVSSRGALGFQLDATVDRGRRTAAFRMTNRWGQLVSRYGATDLGTQTWYHVAGVYDARALTLDVYLNGRPDNGCLDGTVTRRQTASRNAIYVGRAAEPEGFEFAGSIDDVRIYSRALSQEEIRTEIIGPPGPPAEAANSPLGGADTKCRSLEPADPRGSGLLVAVGMFVAIACAGLWPGRHFRTGALVFSTLSGALIVSAASSLGEAYGWLAPALTLVGGTAIAVSIRAAPRSDPSRDDAP